MRLFFRLAALVIVLIVAAVIALPFALNTDMAKAKIAEAVAEATGRDFAIDGAIGLSLFPPARLSASGVHLANAAGGVAESLVSIGSLHATVDAIAMISGDIVVHEVVLDQPVIRLEADAGGRANWELAGAGGPDATAAAEGGATAGAPPRLSLGLLRIENGSFSFRNAAGEEQLAAAAISISVTAPGADQAATVKGGMTLNGEALTLDVGVTPLGAAMAGGRFDLTTALASSLVSLDWQGAIQPGPVPGADGTLALDIASVGTLAAWLGQPLPADQPDPGPLKLDAKLVAEGNTVALTEATIAGDGLSATAHGSLETGDVTKVSLRLEGDRLDIDRYLPPPVPAPAGQPAATDAEAAAPADPFAALPDEPFQLAALQAIEADIGIKLGGLGAMGYELGPLDIALRTRDGAQVLEISELGLYGGNVSGIATLTPGDEGLGVDVTMAMNAVALGELAAAAKAEVPMVGSASGSIRATGAGVSPRALAQTLSGEVVLALGGVETDDEALAAISEMSLMLALPGMEASPNLNFSMVYNGERVALMATTDPLPQVLGAERFNAKLSLTSAMLRASFDGALQQRPAPGIDGDIGLDIGSVAALAAWLGQPLPEDQPDPGPLSLRATAVADGAKLVLTEAVITGDGLNAKAAGTLDRSGPVRRIDLTIDADSLDIDRYLPPPPPPAPEAAPETAAAEPAPAGDPLAGLSEEPLDIEHLREMEGEVVVRIGTLRVKGYEAGPIAYTATMEGGVHRMALSELGLYGGTVKGLVVGDGSGEGLGIDVSLDVNGVVLDRLAELLQAPLGGTATGTLSAKARGVSARELVSSLAANVDMALAGMDPASPLTPGISELSIMAALEGLDGAPTAKVSTVYNGEPTTLAATLSPLREVLGADRFDADLALASAPVNPPYSSNP